MNNTLVASSKNRKLASSPTSLGSTAGWASKSNSEILQGAGRQAKRARLARRRASVASTSTASSRSKSTVGLSLSARA